MREQILQTLLEKGVIAVIRMADVRRLVRVVAAVRAGGVTAIEITMTTPNAFNVITAVAREMGDDVQVGVGSVTSAEVARQAVEAGARYVVSPVFLPEVIAAAHRQGVPAMPGAFTPTEIFRATQAGADVVKVFPADVVGMPFFKGVLAPMPHLKLMPTGGVSLTNAGDWINAGAVAVGVGSALLDKQAIANEDYARLTQNARTLCRSVAEARAERT